MKGRHKVRNLWEKKDLGFFHDSYTAYDLKQHEHALLKIGSIGAPIPAAEPVPVSSLPDAQRQRFPKLTFSTHIYADDADLRAIVVNGSRLQEGDRLQNLVLSQITEEGAVFRFEGRLVSVSVLDDWN